MSRPTLTVIRGDLPDWKDEWWWITLRKFGEQLLADSPSPITDHAASDDEAATSPVSGSPAGGWPPARSLLPVRPSHLQLVQHIEETSR